MGGDSHRHEGDRTERSHMDALFQAGYRYATSLVADPATAEDLVQEACVRISGHGGPWNRNYLFTVIRNLAIDGMRRQSRVRFESLEEHEIEGLPEPDSNDDEDLRSALSTLRPDEREYLFLNVVESFTTAEIASLTGRPRGTVLSLIHRARKKLQKILGDDEGKVAS